MIYQPKCNAAIAVVNNDKDFIINFIKECNLNNKYLCSAFIVSVIENNVDIFKLILESKKVDYYLAMNYALELATENNCTEIVELLLSSKNDFSYHYNVLVSNFSHVIKNDNLHLFKVFNKLNILNENSFLNQTHLAMKNKSHKVFNEYLKLDFIRHYVFNEKFEEFKDFLFENNIKNF